MGDTDRPCGRGAGRIRVPRPRGIHGQGGRADPPGGRQRCPDRRVSRGLHPRPPDLVSLPSRDRARRDPAQRRAVQELVEIPGPEIEEPARRGRRRRLRRGRRVREAAEHDRDPVQHAGVHRARRVAARQASEAHAHRRGAARAHRRARRHAGRLRDGFRAGERADRGELQPARDLRDHRRALPGTRDELAEPFSDRRRAAARAGQDRLAGLRADVEGLRGQRLRHGRRGDDRAPGASPRTQRRSATPSSAAAR